MKSKIPLAQTLILAFLMKFQKKIKMTFAACLSTKTFRNFLVNGKHPSESLKIFPECYNAVTKGPSGAQKN